jgi:hypothetical protein
MPRPRQAVAKCEHKPTCNFHDIWAAGGMTDAEYDFLRGGTSVPEIFRRIEVELGSRYDGTAGVSGIFYALEENRISVSKAMQTLRKFLLSGDLDTYRHAEGWSEDEERIKQLRDMLNKILAAKDVAMPIELAEEIQEVLR